MFFLNIFLKKKFNGGNGFLNSAKTSTSTHTHDGDGCVYFLTLQHRLSFYNQVLCGSFLLENSADVVADQFGRREYRYGGFGAFPEGTNPTVVYSYLEMLHA